MGRDDPPRCFACQLPGTHQEGLLQLVGLVLTVVVVVARQLVRARTSCVDRLLADQPLIVGE